MEAIMAHLILQLGASVLVPFGTVSRRLKGTPHWKVRSLREAAAIDAGLPVRLRRFSRSVGLLLPGTISAQKRHSLYRDEV
jgi:hypothetical protein